MTQGIDRSFNHLNVKKKNRGREKVFIAIDEYAKFFNSLVRKGREKKRI